MRIPATGYQPTGTVQPGTPPDEPAGASSARSTPRTHRIAMTAKAPGEGSTVLLDGHDISRALTAVTLNVAVGHIPTVTLDMLLIDITQVEDSEARILIPDATRDALTALGWTAPPEPGTATEHGSDVFPDHHPRQYCCPQWPDCGCPDGDHGTTVLELGNTPQAATTVKPATDRD